MKLKCLLLSVLLLTVSLVPALAAESEYASLQVLVHQEFGLGDSHVFYPELQDAQGREMIAKVNDAIFQKAEIEEYLRVLKTVTEGSVGLTVDCDYSYDVSNGLFSVVFSASGKMPQGRPSQKYYAMTFDLETGEEVTFDRLFSDPDGALKLIEENMDSKVSDILSTYMENSALLPVPMDNFVVLHDAVTFYYDNDQLSFLSGDSGAVSFWYYELEPYLDLSENSIAKRLQTFERSGIKDAEQLAQVIMDNVSHGVMPGLDVTISAADDVRLSVGADVHTLVDSFKQTTDSGYYPGGSYLEVENALLRGTYILTDESGDEVTGILSKRLDMFGIKTNVTTAHEWREILGQPTASLALDENTAEQYLLCAGSSDQYVYGEHTLTLHADENGVLYAVILQ